MLHENKAFVTFIKKNFWKINKYFLLITVLVELVKNEIKCL